MSKFWGVKDLSLNPLTKRDLLLFDGLAVPVLEDRVKGITEPDIRAEVEWLIDQAIIRNVDINTAVPATKNELALNLGSVLLTLGRILSAQKSSPANAERLLRRAGSRLLVEHGLRSCAAFIELTEESTATALLGSRVLEFEDLTAIREALGEVLDSLPIQIRELNVQDVSNELRPGLTYSGDDTLVVAAMKMIDKLESRAKDRSAGLLSVTRIVIGELPMPDERIGWEELIDYRRDPQTKLYHTRLRQWMRRVANAEYRASEIAEELTGLIAEHEAAMRLAKLKFSKRPLEILLTAAATILESAVRFKWSDGVKALFSARNAQIELLEAENSAPGREVAYILKSRNYFRELPI